MERKKMRERERERESERVREEEKLLNANRRALKEIPFLKIYAKSLLNE